MNDCEMNNRKKMLVVDDVRINRTLLRRIFEDDYEIVEAVNGVEALARLEELRDELVIMVLDILMPKMDGFEVLRRKALDPRNEQIPVIVVTAVSDGDRDARALDLGALDVITKPYDPRTIRQRVRNIISRAASERIAEQNRLLSAMRERDRAHMEQLAYQNDHDELTGIYNRRAFYRRTRELLDASPDTPYVLIRFDVDRFKAFNDMYGTVAGDQLLQSIARSVAELLPEDSTYGHLEADHFAFCVCELGLRLEELICATEHAITTLASGFELVPRFGIYTVYDRTVDIGLMCDRAFLALRSVKESYERHLSYYDESMRERLLQEQQLVGDMEAALVGGQFCFYLQPQVDSATGQIISAEALVRWQHPDKGLIPPDEFLPLFEKNGFIVRLDDYIREQVCLFLRRRLDYGAPVLPISVNLSRVDIASPQLPQRIMQQVERHRLSPDLLRLEITESAYMDSPEQMIAVIDELSRAGFTIEMDDFGKGYSSLNTLKEVPVDILKLDMRFLTGGERGVGRGGTILSAVINMAHRLDLPVVAEGVETREQSEYLRSIGCTYIQGYYFSRPLPCDEYERRFSDAVPASLSPVVSENNLVDADQFWNPNSLNALLFNSYVGGAQILSCSGDTIGALQVNRSFYEVLGITHETYNRYRLRILDTIVPQHRSVFLGAIEDAVATGQEIACEFECHFPDCGRHVWLRCRLRLLSRRRGDYILYEAVENIDERVKLLDEMRALSGELTNIIDFIPGGVFRYTADEQARFGFVSRTMYKMLGYTEQGFLEAFGGSFNNLVYEKDRAAVLASIAEQIALGDTDQCEYRVRCADGSLKWVYDVGHIVTDETGQRWFYVVIVDVDRTKRELEAGRDFLSRFLRDLPCGVIERALCSDTDGEALPPLQSINAAAVRILDMDEDNPDQALELSAIYPEDAGAFLAMHRRVSQTRVSESYSVRILHRGGELRHISGELCVARDHDGREQLIATLLDITEQVHMRRSQDINDYSRMLLSIYDTVSRIDYATDTVVELFCKDDESAKIGVERPLLSSFRRWVEEEVHPDYSAAVCEFYDRDFLRREMARGNISPNLRYRLTDRDGRERWVSTSLRCVLEDTFLVCTRDITNRTIADRLADENRLLRERAAEQEHYRAVFEQINATILEYEAGTGRVYASPNIAKYRLGQMELSSLFGGEELYTAVPSDDVERLHAFLSDCRDGRTLCETTLRLLTAEGESLWARVSVHIIRDEAGKVFRVIVTVFDIDDSIRFDDRLKIERERARLLAETGDVVGLEINLPADTLEYTVPSAQGGRQVVLVSDFTARFPQTDIVAPEHRQMIRSTIEMVTQERGDHCFEFRADFFGGGYRWYGCSLTGIEDQDGKLRHIVGNLSDITLRKAVSLGNAETGEFLMSVLNNATSGVFRVRVDQQYTIVYCNEVYRRIRGIYHDLTGHSSTEFILPEDLPRCREIVEEAIRERKHTVTFEERICTPTGVRWLLKSCGISYSDPDDVYIDGVEQDITTLRAAEHRLEQQDRLYQILIEDAAQLVFDYDAKAGLFSYSFRDRKGNRIIRELPDLLDTLPELTAVDPNDRGEMLARFRAAIASPRDDVFEYRASYDHRKFRWYRASYRSITDSDGDTLRIVGKAEDIHEEKLLEERLREETEFRNTVLSHAVFAGQFDLSGKHMRLLNFNEQQAEAFFDWAHYARIGHHPELIAPDDLERAQALFSDEELLRRLAASEFDFSHQLRVKQRDGHFVWVEMTVHLFGNSDPELLRGVLHMELIEHEKQRDEALRKKAEYDAVTALYNRATAEEQITAALSARSVRGVFAIIDVDNFKSINDTYGHPFGDKVLGGIAGILRESCRTGDIVGRIGGDEFAVFYRDTVSIDFVGKRVSALIESISLLEKRLAMSKPVSVSVGVAVADRDDRSFADIFAKADEALYHAKAAGKHCFAVYDAGAPPMHKQK